MTPKQPQTDASTLDEQEPVEAELVGQEVALGQSTELTGDGSGTALPAVPTNDDGAVIALIQPDPEWDDVDTGDLAPSTSRIRHLTVNRNLDGGFIDAETGEKSASLEFVWLAKGRSRAWFRGPFGKGDAAPSCRSFDGVKADPASPELQNGGDCSTCPLRVWKEGEKPECRESVEALVFIPDSLGVGRLARLRWHGIAVRPALDFWESFDSRMPRRPPIAYVSHVELVATDTKFGEKLSPRFSRVKELTRSAAQPLIDERDRRLAEWQADTAKAVAATTVAEVDDGADLPPQEWRGEDGAEEPF